MSVLEKPFVLACLLLLPLIAAAGSSTQPSADAEVHVVGLYEADAHQHLELIQPRGRDIEWVKLCSALVEQGNGQAPTPGKRIWELLPDDAKQLMANPEFTEEFDDLQKPDKGRFANRRDATVRKAEREADARLHTVYVSLFKILLRRDFYDDASFTGVKLSDDVRQLINRHQTLSELECRFLNRRLFEAAFPEAVKPIEFTIEKATVPVRIAATEHPLIVVLCSYQSIRWVLQPEPGAKVEQVIVGGHELQEVSGTDAPVQNFCLDPVSLLQGKTLDKTRYFHAYKRDEEDYPKLVKTLEQITGKPLTSFQGRYKYAGGAPIVVGPPPPVEPEDDLISEGVDTITFSLGTELKVVCSGPAGCTWEEPPVIEAADNSPIPVELVRLEPIENPDVWFTRTPVLLFNIEPDHFENWKGKQRPEGKSQQFVLWRFRGIAPGSATITLTRHDATGAKKTVQMILSVQ